MQKRVIVIGGGIVGLSTAMQLIQRYPDFSVTVIEKESDVATHQTGHNSGVIHAGVYYAPGSLKAQFCREGAQATIEFCQRHNIPFDQCGKLIVATNDLGLERMEALFHRCVANGLEPTRLGRDELLEREPRIRGSGAIFVASSGITDYPAISRAIASEIALTGGSIVKSATVLGIRENDVVSVETTKGVYSADFVIVCGGLHADKLAAMCGIEIDFRIVPFRGEYFRLPAAKNDVVKHLIYPVPDPSLPFLGVHLTRMIGGYVTVGPNAVLALAREGYSWGNVSVKDLAEMAMFPGFWKVLLNNRRSAATELKNSISRRGYLRLCQEYCPELDLTDLEPYPAGVRAQAVLRDGTLVHDFLIRSTGKTLHVCNAPSPAATSALPIGKHLVQMFAEAVDR